MTKAYSQLTITDLNDISIKSQINLYCRASVSTGSAEEGPDITKIDGYDSADLTKELWSSEIPSATSEFPYVWIKQIIEYDGDIPTFITYTLFTTSDSIEIGGKNLLLQSNNYENFYCTSNSNDTKILKDMWLNNDTAIIQVKLNTISSDGNIAKIYWNNQFQNNAILSSDKNYVISYDLLFKKSIDSEGLIYDTIDGTQYTSINNNGNDFIIDAVINNNEITTYYNIINQNKIIEIALNDNSGNSYLHHECYFTINDKDNNGVKIDTTNCRYYPAISISKMNNDDHWLRVYITNLKLEEGNISTNWEPAPEDNNIPIESIAAALGIIKVEPDTIDKYKGNFGFDDNTGAFMTHFIASNMLQSDAIYSSDIPRDENGTVVITKDGFLEKGTLLDLSNGKFISKNFKIDTDGSASFKGSINALSGTIGGFTIDNNILKSGTVGISGQENLYNADKMLWAGAVEENNIISNANFYVTNNGFMKATSGNIGGITINSDGLNTNSEAGFILSNTGDFSLGDALTYIASEKKLSLSEGSVSISSFNTNEQTQLNMTKYITSKDGKITFSNIDKNNNPTGSKLIIDSEGLKLSYGTTDKINISSDGVLIGSTNNGVNITNSNIEIMQENRGIDISSASINFKNNSGTKIMSLSTEGDSRIVLGNKEIANSTYMEFFPGGITLGKTNEEYKSSKMFSLSEKGFIFGNSDGPNPETTTSYFAVGDKLVYDANIGFGISMNALELIWGNSNLKSDALWENDSNTSGGAPVNILITDKGMGFFQNDQVNDPIAYFSNNKFYVKRTQVVTEQEISGFKWFVRDGSDYVTENGETLHNLGLKWVG